MNKRQLSEYIGNIDDRLVQQAENLPDYAARRRRKGIRRFWAAAAALALMAFSFSAGAIAFGRETVVEVPAARETLEWEGMNLTLILPDSWKDQYSTELEGNRFTVYNPQIRAASGSGVLFTIVSYGESMTEEQFMENESASAACRYLLTTGGWTYILYYASDPQYDPADREQERIYQKMMSEIEEIQIVVNHMFPPKDLLVAPEGAAGGIQHTALGKEPAGEIPGFVIYVDTERYDTAEESGRFYIRPAGVGERSELVCEMEIEAMPDITREEAAQTLRARLCREQETGNWDSVSDISRDRDIERLHFLVSEGTAWDSAQEEHYFYEMGGQGTYHIVLRYFLEAAEGNGARFHAMLDTFSCVAP